MGTWLKYAAWEASQKEWERARSVYERCLDVDYKHHQTWLRYAEVGLHPPPPPPHRVPPSVHSLACVRCCCTCVPPSGVFLCARMGCANGWVCSCAVVFVCVRRSCLVAPTRRQMEMKNKFINHARNIWDRAVTLLPRVDQFWYAARGMGSTWRVWCLRLIDWPDAVVAPGAACEQVQVHIHGGAAGQLEQRPCGVRAVDEVEPRRPGGVSRTVLHGAAVTRGHRRSPVPAFLVSCMCGQLCSYAACFRVCCAGVAVVCEAGGTGG